MSLKLANILATSGLQAVPSVGRPAPAAALIIRDAGNAHDDSTDDDGWLGPEPQAARRTRIWEFGTNLHCSIIGTCLSTADLRQVLEKLRIERASTADDHDLHCLGVLIAARRDGGAKFLHKALDRRHRAAIARYAKAKDVAGLIALWEEALKQGDIPGAYWAVLTHPVTTEDVIKQVFGDVHMLSHLVGAANRADIRRLRQLEEDNAALTAKVERQQRQLHEGFVTRDHTIRRLNTLVARQAGELCERPLSAADQLGGLDIVVQDLNRQLARATARRERSEQKASELAAATKDKESTLQASRRECEALRGELALVEQQLAALTRPEAPFPESSLDLSGLTLLYVGGRAHQVPQFKELAERAGAQFLHHDGGIEHSPALLAGLVSRADHVFFPIDCISHDAMAGIKRLCRIHAKVYAPLRTASLTCLLSALVRVFGVGAAAAAE